MIIGVDLDGVVADYTGGVLRFAEHFLGKPKNYYGPPMDWDFSDHDFTTMIGEKLEFKDIHRAFVDPEGGETPGLLKLKALPWAVWGIRQLAQDHTIRIVTQRGAGSRGIPARAAHMTQTLFWLQKKDIPFDEIYFTNDKTSVICDVMLEDAPHHLRSFVDQGLSFMIFDQPYNRQPEFKDYLRVNGWPDAIQHIEKMASVVDDVMKGWRP